MPVNALKPLLFVILCLCSVNALAQPDDAEASAILELGGAASRGLQGDGSAFGPAVAVEVTPIENWLELEAGVTPLFSHGTTEWDTDLIFKKPWTLSRKAEFMAGLGPEWVHTKGTNSVSGEAVLDFMFWPSAKHRIGWYVEPAYEYSFARSHQRSIGISGGLLIAIR